jgi:hypothetical protein
MATATVIATTIIATTLTILATTTIATGIATKRNFEAASTGGFLFLRFDVANLAAFVRLAIFAAIRRTS